MLHLADRDLEAVTIVSAAYRRALSQNLPGHAKSWLALMNSMVVRETNEKLHWLDLAAGHATDGKVEMADVLSQRAHVVEVREERLDALNRATAIYRSFGVHGGAGGALLRMFRGHYSAGELDDAMRVLLEATDLSLEHDAVLDIDVWDPLLDMAVWAPQHLSLLAFRELAACVNHETLKEKAESWIVNAATRLIAQKARPHEEVIELLQTARDDLTRERRTLLEPFIFAARMEEEPHEAVLFELSEPMRAVIADVRRRVEAERKKASRPRPAWAKPAEVKAKRGGASPRP